MHWLSIPGKDSEHLCPLRLGIRVPKDTQHSHALDGISLYLHREDTTRSAPAVCMGPQHQWGQQGWFWQGNLPANPSLLLIEDRYSIWPGAIWHTIFRQKKRAFVKLKIGKDILTQVISSAQAVWALSLGEEVSQSKSHSYGADGGLQTACRKIFFPTYSV